MTSLPIRASPSYKAPDNHVGATPGLFRLPRKIRDEIYNLTIAPSEAWISARKDMFPALFRTCRQVREEYRPVLDRYFKNNVFYYGIPLNRTEMTMNRPTYMQGVKPDVHPGSMNERCIAWRKHMQDTYRLNFIFFDQMHLFTELPQGGVEAIQYGTSRNGPEADFDAIWKIIEQGSPYPDLWFNDDFSRRTEIACKSCISKSWKISWAAWMSLKMLQSEREHGPRSNELLRL